MPLYLVATARAPRPHPCRRNGKTFGFCEEIVRALPRAPRFRLLGRLDFRHHPRDVRLRFRVPRLRPSLYQFVIYCGPCYPGKNGSLITDGSHSLRVGR